MYNYIFYVHGINRYKYDMYRFNLPVQVKICMYMVQTCLYHFAKSCQDLVRTYVGTYWYVPF